MLNLHDFRFDEDNKWVNGDKTLTRRGIPQPLRAINRSTLSEFGHN
jgi:hypothetical protein